MITAKDIIDICEDDSVPDSQLDPKDPGDRGLLQARLDDIRRALKTNMDPGKKGQLAARADDIERMLKK